jgi:VIT1/CCC1 family predicted Fe2+/Mn2+ transporter
MTYVYAPIWLITLLSVALFAFGAFLGRISK